MGKYLTWRSNMEMGKYLTWRSNIEMGKYLTDDLKKEQIFNTVGTARTSNGTICKSR